MDSLASYASASGDLAAPISVVLAADALRIAASLKRGEEVKGFEEEVRWQMSPWGAYTASLSPPPSLDDDEGLREEQGGQNSGSGGGGCAGWFLPRKAREAALVRFFPSASRRKQVGEMLDEALRVEKEAAEATAEAAFLGKEGKNKGKGVTTTITPRLLTWARSQICSRAFAAPGSEQQRGEIVPALLPVIDLCNHSPRGGFPAWGVVSSSAAAGSESSSLGSSPTSDASPPPPPPSPPPPRLCWLRNASPLSAGEELTTDYSRLCGGDAGAWMATSGFVPEEAK